MTDHYLFALSFAAALGCGLMAGIFFAFSNFVMRALAKIPPSQGIAVMQAVNITVLNPLFLLTFMGTGLLCAAAIALVLMNGESHDSGYLLAGGVLYLLGNIGVTVVFNVPMNDALSRVEADSQAASTSGRTIWTIGYFGTMRAP